MEFPKFCQSYMASGAGLASAANLCRAPAPAEARMTYLSWDEIMPRVLTLQSAFCRA